jgi:hypothetical protein
MRAGLIAGFVTIILFTTGVVVAETYERKMFQARRHSAAAQTTRR